MSSHRTRYVSVFVALSLALVACGGGEDEAAVDTDSGAATTVPTTVATTVTQPEITLPPRPPSDYAGFAAQPTACGAEAPNPVTPMVFDAPEDLGLDPAKKVQVTITTSCGDIEVELDPAIAPATVNSFVFLARSGYFDGTVSHRIIPEYIIQAGDPTGTGRGNPGYAIPDELPAADFLYEAGVLAMANAGPNTSGSQFFIVLSDAPLPPAYSFFGEVVGGIDTLELIAGLPLGQSASGEPSVPLETLYIEQVTISE